ncbi:MAG TPA: sigma-54 dependent transcriptional regulator [Bdellovibrionota bacterium]|nr:sigma-54 dependent transcriptional regulator [Bdellovibrionota bacterium]
MNFTVPKEIRFQDEGKVDDRRSPNRGEVFVIDDDRNTLSALEAAYVSQQYDVRAFSDAISALAELGERKRAGAPECDLIVCDLVLPQMDGIELVRRLKQNGVEVPVIVITGHGSREIGVRAMQAGVFDYVVKPVNLLELEVLSDRAIRLDRMRRGYQYLRQHFERPWKTGEMIGKSHLMQQVFLLVEQVSFTSSNVLITGESGTGKELLARMIHSKSSRGNQPFVAVNCSAIPETLLESELFGHVKGAFTGASQERIGLFQEANGGTLFLDEIGDMPLIIQGKVLRAVQDRKIRSLGENRLRSVDVRLIAATHRDLRKEVQEGRFREDLYYRICVIPIEIPPLRERSEDIPLLAEHFLAHYVAINQRNIKGFTKEAMAKLLRLGWEGNVRELQNAIERAVVLCRTTLIDESDLQTAQSRDAGTRISTLFSDMVTLPQLEREYVKYVLHQTSNRKEQAAKILGIDRKTLYRKVREYSA